MDFPKDPVIKEGMYQPTQAQYIVMSDSPQNSWFITKHDKQ